MSWPTPQDYNEAVQNPQVCFKDQELRNGVAETTPLGLPKPITGGFASVYRMKCGQRDWAVRCFLRPSDDQQSRYHSISSYINHMNQAYFVGFEFLQEGILIRGKWYPMLKMEWVEGVTLDRYVESVKMDPAKLIQLSHKWLKMIADLRKVSIAHGDLQHGNILVVNDELKLIDYDGMYVPELKGKRSSEVGHRNYQHPGRSETDFNETMDNFSAWIIYLSIVSLAAEPSLWDVLDGGDECLLFREEDFKDPLHSVAFATMEQLPSSTIRLYLDFVKSLLFHPISNMPELNQSVINEIFNKNRSNAPNFDDEWIGDLTKDPNEETKLETSSGLSPYANGASWVLDYLEPKQASEMNSSVLAERVILSIFALATLGLPFIFAYHLINMMALSLSASSFYAAITSFFLYRYQNLPMVIKRKRLIEDIKKTNMEIKSMEIILEPLENEIVNIRQNYNEKWEEISKQKDSNSKWENEELDKIHQNFQKELLNINQQRNDLKNTEDKYLSDTLKRLQEQFLKDGLRRYDLARANLSGIGPQIIKCLHSAGIRTAADIIDIQIAFTGSGLYQHEVAYINIVGKGSIRVEGIGAKKAVVLRNWRLNVENRVKSKLPKSLPIREIHAIKAKTKSQFQQLDLKEIEIKNDTQLRINQLRQKYRDLENKLAQEMERLKAEFQVKLEEMDTKIVEQKKLLSYKTWEYSKIQDDLEILMEINFQSYMKNIFRSRSTGKRTV